jgi:hypothetical protein
MRNRAFQQQKQRQYPLAGCFGVFPATICLIAVARYIGGDREHAHDVSPYREYRACSVQVPTIFLPSVGNHSGGRMSGLQSFKEQFHRRGRPGSILLRRADFAGI